MKRLTLCIAIALVSGTVIAAEADRSSSPWPQRRSQPPRHSAGDQALIAPATPAKAPVQKIGGDYQILLHRSIFALNGLARSESGPNGRFGAFAGRGPGGPTSRPSAEARLALRGTAIQDGLRYAFLEDTETHQGRRVHAGDQVASGKVIEISMDGLRFRTGDHETQVSHGSTLEGHPAPAPLASAASGFRDKGWGSRDRRNADKAGPRPDADASQQPRQAPQGGGEATRGGQPQAVADAGGRDDGPGGGPGIDGPPIDFGPPPGAFGPQPGDFGPGGFGGGPFNFPAAQAGPGGPPAQ